MRSMSGRKFWSFWILVGVLILLFSTIAITQARSDNSKEHGRSSEVNASEKDSDDEGQDEDCDENKNGNGDENGQGDEHGNSTGNGNANGHESEGNNHENSDDDEACPTPTPTDTGTPYPGGDVSRAGVSQEQLASLSGERAPIFDGLILVLLLIAAGIIGVGVMVARFLEPKGNDPTA